MKLNLASYIEAMNLTQSYLIIKRSVNKGRLFAIDVVAEKIFSQILNKIFAFFIPFFYRY